MIQLNVGGTEFYTTRVTLFQQPQKTYFSLLDQEQNNFFIDRDPTFFIYILNSLRGCKIIPYSRESLERLYEEADFYSMEDLKKSISYRLKVVTIKSCEQSLDIIAKKIES